MVNCASRKRYDLYSIYPIPVNGYVNTVWLHISNQRIYLWPWTEKFTSNFQGKALLEQPTMHT